MAQGERLAQAQIDAVTAALEKSPSWRAAADHAGANERTIHRYRERADAYTKRHNPEDNDLPNLPDETDPDYPYFVAVTAWVAARSRLEMKLVTGVLDAIPKDWKAAHAMLKSGWPQDYSDRVEVTGAGGGPLQVDALIAEALPRAEEAIRKIREKRAAAGTEPEVLDPAPESEISGNEVDSGGD